MTALPERTRVYQNHHIDSTRWDAFKPRPDDIVIVTSYKAGTTWTQAIVANLLFPDQAFPMPPWNMNTWIESRSRPESESMAKVEAQTHRRFLKCHLAIDGLPFNPDLKYIFVSRDGRDVGLSMWNHYSNYVDDIYGRLNDTPGRVGPPLPRPPADLAEFWRNWCTRGWFPWESDGWPFWSHLNVSQSWWNYRDLPNILVVHYADMTRDLEGCVRQMADFLEIPLTPARAAEIAVATSFDAMKQEGATYVPSGGETWKGGIDTFMNQGGVGRWQGRLSAEELALYDAACDRSLTDDCRAWLADGAQAL